ncbi:hypothetical protein EXU57_19930 [Segetibacter sp. 3557_3]|uniref:hypothetical protein n=1 Tax=Segetibacter sp. 3557_3 TaxID=2547429 RepID=UPI001058C039|nr:hypothetical protein [Segetibacter sp. 3557_3]TDH21466.1 hypothetical protein EXU57_19930 [Segetibacter sp. 3557_3]
MKRYALLLMIAIAVAGCEKDVETGDYFAFGTAANFCLDDCARFYKIADNKLYPDNIKRYPGKLNFSETALPGDKYELARSLEANFPEYLDRHADTTFGCPDCYDQGGIHIERRRNAKTEVWHFDPDVNQQPAEVRPYLQEMASILSKLR